MKNTRLTMAFAIAVAPLLPVALACATEFRASSSFSSNQLVKKVVYDQEQIVDVIGSYGYQSTIEFAPDEQIKLRTLGDAIAWQIIPKGHRVFVKPLEINAATNMTIVTNKRTYLFRLTSTDKPHEMTFMVRFIYPDTGASPPALSTASITETSEELQLPGTELAAIVTSPPDYVEVLPVSIPSEPLPLWTLTAGKSIGQELTTWADKAGWKVIWNLPNDWTIPADTTYEGEFSDAAAKVIETLAGNGALIRSQFYEGNKTMVINGPGVPAQ